MSGARRVFSIASFRSRIGAPNRLDSRKEEAAMRRGGNARGENGEVDRLGASFHYDAESGGRGTARSGMGFWAVFWPVLDGFGGRRRHNHRRLDVAWN